MNLFFVERLGTRGEEGVSQGPPKVSQGAGKRGKKKLSREKRNG